MVRLSRHVVLSETDYGAVLLDQESGQYWTLNQTGALALRVLLDGGDAGQAVEAVLERYEVDSDTAVRDVSNLLAELREAGLVTV